MYIYFPTLVSQKKTTVLVVNGRGGVGLRGNGKLQRQGIPGKKLDKNKDHRSSLKSLKFKPISGILTPGTIRNRFLIRF